MCKQLYISTYPPDTRLAHRSTIYETQLQRQSDEHLVLKATGNIFSCRAHFGCGYTLSNIVRTLSLFRMLYQPSFPRGSTVETLRSLAPLPRAFEKIDHEPFCSTTCRLGTLSWLLPYLSIGSRGLNMQIPEGVSLPIALPR